MNQCIDCRYFGESWYCNSCIPTNFTPKLDMDLRQGESERTLRKQKEENEKPSLMDMLKELKDLSGASWYEKMEALLKAIIKRLEK